MKKHKIFKALVLLICLFLLLCLAACKSGVSTGSANSSVAVSEQSDNSGKNEASANTDSAQSATDGKTHLPSSEASQGIELEEDIFDNSDIQSAASNSTDGNATSSESASNQNQSDSNASSDNSSENDSSDSDVSEETTSSDDGTVKLPVDWFD